MGGLSARPTLFFCDILLVALDKDAMNRSLALHRRESELDQANKQNGVDVGWGRVFGRQETHAEDRFAAGDARKKRVWWNEISGTEQRKSGVVEREGRRRCAEYFRRSEEERCLATAAVAAFVVV